jgi:hypothetical protein
VSDVRSRCFAVTGTSPARRLDQLCDNRQISRRLPQCRRFRRDHHADTVHLSIYPIVLIVSHALRPAWALPLRHHLQFSVQSQVIDFKD